MVLEPWEEMLGAPMAGEFFEVCERLDPEVDALHRAVAHECVTTILGDDAAAEVFLLALDGPLADQPASDVLEQRLQILAERFVRTTRDRKV
jgi:TetR/AcrR family transcriptional regulator, transcriptional repressor of aconitase